MTKFAERKKKWGTEMIFKSISLPVNIIEKLKLLKETYREHYGRQVSYGEIFERLFSQMALGNVDPGVYSSFTSAMKSHAEFDEVVTRSTQELADKIERRAKANGTSIVEEAMKEKEAVKERVGRERKLYAEKEARCIEIVRAASPALPTDSWWAHGEWYVNENTGQFFPVTKGKDGKSDYAFTNGAVLGRRFVSEIDMLSKEGGFIRVKIDE